MCLLLAVGGAPAVADSCPNAQFRSGYGAQLPDCRAYEQASPVDKDGQGVSVNGQIFQAAADGDAVSFGTASAVPGAQGAENYGIYFAQRGADGWTTRGIYPPESFGNNEISSGWTPDLSEALVEESQAGIDKAPPALLMRSSADGSFKTVVPSNTGANYYYVGASADGSLVYFDEKGAVIVASPTVVKSTNNVYVWNRDTGQLSLVDVLPGGNAPTGGGDVGPYNWWNTSQAAILPGVNYYRQQAISSDGESVVFSGEDPSQGSTYQVFVREDPASASASTVEASRSQKTNGSGANGTDPNGPQSAAFMTASTDGSKVFFASQAELTNNANTGTADQGNDLYEYDVSTGSLTDITADANAGDADGADVQGVVGASDDGSYVYFVANGVLASNDGVQGQPATLGDCTGRGSGNSFAGTCNLYVRHDGTTRFIAPLDADSSSGIAGWGGDWWDWEPTIFGGPVAAPKTAQVSSDGSAMLFSSQLQLTGYANDNQPELYRYDAASGQFDCVSCDPSGAAPSGAPSLTERQSTEANGNTQTAFLQRNLSADGNRVFFNSPDPLAPSDTNATTDVYEWEAEGTGSCTSSGQDGGCLYLLSTGRGADPSYFVDASADGDDAFIATDEQLVGQDGDTAIDVYDARVGGGLASQWPSVVQPCDGAACRGSETSPSPEPVIGTVGFSGPGDVAAPAVVTEKVRVTRRSVHGSVFSLIVKVPVAGTVTVTGADIGSVTKRPGRAGSYRVVLRLTAKAKRALKRKRRLRVAVRVVYRPPAGRASSVRVAMTVKA